MWEEAVCGSLNASCVEFAGDDDKLNSGKLTVNDQQRVSHGVTPQRPEGQKLGIPADRMQIIGATASKRQWRSEIHIQGKSLIGMSLPIRLELHPHRECSKTAESLVHLHMQHSPIDRQGGFLDSFGQGGVGVAGAGDVFAARAELDRSCAFGD